MLRDWRNRDGWRVRRGRLLCVRVCLCLGVARRRRGVVRSRRMVRSVVGLRLTRVGLTPAFLTARSADFQTQRRGLQENLMPIFQCEMQ